MPPGRSTRRTSASAAAGVGDRAQRERRQHGVVRLVRPRRAAGRPGRCAAPAPGCAPGAARRAPSRRRRARPRRASVTAAGRWRRFSPLPKPISSTRPCSPAQAAPAARPTSAATSPVGQPGHDPVVHPISAPDAPATVTAVARRAAASVGSRHERAQGDGDRGRVRDLGDGPAAGQPDGGLLADRQRLRQRHRAGPPGPLGLRGGVAAARRPRLRHVAPGRRRQPAHRRGRLGLANVILTNGARLYVDHAHPEYSTPECTDAARHRAVGQGGGAGDARRRRGGPASCPAARRSCSTRTTPTTRARPTAPTRTT